MVRPIFSYRWGGRMKHAEFQDWLAQASRLTRSQREKAIVHISDWPSKSRHYRQKCTKKTTKSKDEELEKVLKGNPVCPNCSATRAYRWGKRQGLQRYRCRVCQHTFNVLSQTPLAGLRKKEHWISYADCLEQSLTLRASAAICEIDFKTAFRWRHRFMEMISEDQAEDLEGIIEADETFFRESLKGKRRMPRPSRKRGTPASKRRRSKEWVKAVIFRDRRGATHELALQEFKAAELVSELAFSLRSDAVLCSDGSPVYAKLAKALALHHESVNVSAGERSRGAFHIQNVNAYHSRLKGWIRRFHGVGTYYLTNYLGWHRLLDGHQKLLTPSKLICVALGKEHFQPTTPS